ncbi:MAG: phosphatidate cytidylyltransferase [Acidimicrobiales bacterium]
MDERDEYEPEDEALSEPITERVRIIGAQPAGAVAGRAPGEDPPVAEPTLPGMTASPPGREAEPAEAHPPLIQEPVGPLHAEEAGRSAPSGRNGGDPLEPPMSGFTVLEPPAAAPDMPHWTDPPTGQVPAVLDRRGDEDEGAWSASGDTGPAWREHSHEWEESGFDPSLLADDETRVGALEETPVEERRPWEFHDLGAPGERAADDPDATTSWWDEGEERDDTAAEPVVVPRPTVISVPVDRGERPGTEHLPTDQGPDAERGVASISSSPLRFGVRDALSSTMPGANRGRRGRARGVPPVPPVTGTRGDGPGRDMPVAIATGVGFVVLALVCFALGSVATVVLATLVVGLAAAEYNKALRRSRRHPAALLVLVAAVGVMIAAYVKGPTAVPLVLVLVVVASMIWYLAGADRGSAVEGISITVLGFAWIGVLGSFAALLLAPGQFPHRHGVAFLLGAVVASVGADVGGLAIGSWLGRRPLAPTISPNKTWEGVIGGGLVAIAVSAAITGAVHPWSVPKAALLGLVVAVVAPLGDLCESLLKRDLGLKDMGSMLPGHGGVLDRVDAILFVLPATYYLVRVLNLG